MGTNLWNASALSEAEAPWWPPLQRASSSRAQAHGAHGGGAASEPRGEQLAAGLAKIADKYPNILGEVRGWGLLRGVVVKDDAGCTAGELVGDVMKEGLLLVPAGPSVVRFVPPLIVNEAQINQALEMFEEAVAKRA